MIQKIVIFILLILTTTAYAACQNHDERPECRNRTVNVYAYTGEVPDFIVQQFEKETGIKVNFSTYENNEMMYAKLRASPPSTYDIVMPSGYFVTRMYKRNMLEKLDKSQLPNWKNLNPAFLHPAYDPDTTYSMPFIWGVTGIFVNDQYYSPPSITSWKDLWSPRFNNKLMMLDDTREIFSIALITLGYPMNDQNPKHLHEAYLKAKALMPNIKVFSTDTVVSIIIDEDVTIGAAWNGDVFKASQDNPHVKFIFPKEGFIIWVDNFAVAKNPPHPTEAYQFINFILRPDVAKQIALYTSYPIANLAAQQLLPPEIRNNPTIYPSQDILKRGSFQTDLSDETLALYEKYWEELKMSG
ncbi:MAG: spermidine/putrescine ABC transporter substrate-binding protein [Gammaproteobacteria bacterium RIFCSPHIGHO2_12_FULL_38_14]|nr:MAG: spermidine/putrescine ABC transporter substrate-binding protein [Gammaproteobacteria bacterium RIFCSPHIGHO2_12_FULL_38_14]